MPSKNKSLYSEVVEVTTEYLGPAADRFVTRQIRNHLGKDPEELKKADLEALISWIKLAMSLITNDTRTINQYLKKLVSLPSSKVR